MTKFSGRVWAELPSISIDERIRALEADLAGDEGTEEEGMPMPMQPEMETGAEQFAEPERMPEYEPEPEPQNEIDARIAALEASIAEDEAPRPNSAQNLVKGYLATGPAGIPDMVLAGAKNGQEFLRGAQERIAKNLNVPSPEGGIVDYPLPEPGVASQWAGQKFHDITGIPQSPEGTPITKSELAGQFLSPVPVLSKLVNPLKVGAKAAAKAAGRAGVESLGMATALDELPNITEEGGALEDIAKTVIGGVAAKGAMKGAAGIGKAIANPRTTLAKIASLGADPNIEALKLAEKQGIELPLSVGLGSTPLNWLNNVFQKTIFASKKFKDAMQKSNESMLGVVKKNLDELGPDALPHEASEAAKTFITGEEKAIKKVVKDRYSEASVLLKPGDAVVPRNAVGVINAMEEILTRHLKSDETRKAVVHILKLAKEWGILPKNLKVPNLKQLGKLADNPKNMQRFVDSIKEGGRELQAIPIQKLEGARTELGNILKHKKKVLGMEGWLQSMKEAIGKDLDTSTNQAYVQSRKGAHKLYADVYASRFKEDIAKSIITGTEPLYAYSKLTNSKNIKILEKIAGESPQAKAIVDALKKAKAREILSKAITEEGVHTGNFARVFETNEVKQQFLKDLLGPNIYQNLSEVAKIMRQKMKAGQEILNTSGTSHVTADMKTLGKLKIEVSTAIMSIFSVKSAAATIASINLGSRLLVDPEFVTLTRAFAIARKNGNAAYSGQLLENMGKRATAILKSTAPSDVLKSGIYTATKPTKEEEE